MDRPDMRRRRIGPALGYCWSGYDLFVNPITDNTSAEIDGQE